MTKWKIYIPYKLILLIIIALLIIVASSLVVANKLGADSNTSSSNTSGVIELLSGFISWIAVLLPNMPESLYIFVLMIPLLLMLYVIVFEKVGLWYVPAFGWVASFVLFLYKGSFEGGNYIICFFDPGLKVPLFVPIAAFLGATSYITVSILENREKELSDSEWINVKCAYGRRLFMAPYIAIIALFTIFVAISGSATNVANTTNQWAIVFFAYFVGLYTKAIEGTLEEIGMKFLTKKQKIELANRAMKHSDIVIKLDASTSIAYKLKAQGIIKICDLIAMREDDIEQIAKKAEIDKSYLDGLKEKAKNISETIQKQNNEGA